MMEKESERQNELKKDDQDDFWKTQYQLLSNWQIQEANRFWIRFQISLLLNGGLLAAYSAIFGLKYERSVYEIATLIGPLAISLVGIALSFIWHKLGDAGAKWQDYWVQRGIEIEKAHSEDIEITVFSRIPPYEPVAPVRRYRRLIPVVFIITWVVLALTTIISIILSSDSSSSTN